MKFEVEQSPAGSEAGGYRAVMLASATDRLLAWLVDSVIGGGIFIVATVVAGVPLFLLFRPEPNEFSEGFWFVGVVGFAVMFGVLATFLWYIVLLYMVATRGQTPGKKLLKIRIVKEDGSDLDWSGALLREFLGKVVIIGAITSAFGGGWWFGGIFTYVTSILGDYVLYLHLLSFLVLPALFIWIVVDEKNQTLHDKIARTYVVKD